MTVTKHKFLLCISLLISGLILVLGHTPTLAAVYVYELPNGSKLITDKKQYGKGYKLKNTYQTTTYRNSSSNKPYYAATIKSQYDAYIVNIALKYDLEPAFIKAIMHIESAFDANAISRAGAMGLMQLMPATAASYELTHNQFEPRNNIEVGVRHMKDLMDRYDGDKTLSLAAYNAGAGAVSRYNGVPPYKETQDYVVKVMGLYEKYKKEI
ncbi:MAG: lytic transglycosylase domain-containing protein [Acidiferrobacterales bacterium]|nr:lytic transglycosylase domain-containing protein [Acidiferrobacterales bacterium]